MTAPHDVPSDQQEEKFAQVTAASGDRPPSEAAPLSDLASNAATKRCEQSPDSKDSNEKKEHSDPKTSLIAEKDVGIDHRTSRDVNTSENRTVVEKREDQCAAPMAATTSSDADKMAKRARDDATAKDDALPAKISATMSSKAQRAGVLEVSLPRSCVYDSNTTSPLLKVSQHTENGRSMSPTSTVEEQLHAEAQQPLDSNTDIPKPSVPVTLPSSGITTSDPDNQSKPSQATSMAANNIGSSDNPSAGNDCDSAAQDESKLQTLPPNGDAKVKPIFGSTTPAQGFGTVARSGQKLQSFAGTGPNSLPNHDGKGAVAAPSSVDEGKFQTTSLKLDADGKQNDQLVSTPSSYEDGEADEESKFSTRGTLYVFKNVWKECGQGTIKFNISKSPVSSEEQSPHSCRLIMRAERTFRLILNAPLHKNMKFGDSQGNEPNSKNFFFAVLHNDKLTPHMIKFPDATCGQELYQEIRGFLSK